MADIDQQAIMEYMIGERSNAINTALRLSAVTGRPLRLLTKDEEHRLCVHFGVDTLGDVFKKLDVKRAAK